MKDLSEAPVKKKRISRQTLPPGVAKILKRLHFPVDVILTCARWCVAYSLSRRNLEEMMEDHGVRVDPSTVHQWVAKPVPPFEKAFGRHKRPVGESWRINETCVKVRDQWKYLYLVLPGIEVMHMIRKGQMRVNSEARLSVAR